MSSKWLPNRRLLLTAGLAAMGAGICGMTSGWARTLKHSFDERLAEIEADADGRIGVAVLDTGNDRSFGYRLQERFPMCSTFKVMAAGATLKRSMSETDLLQRHVVFSREDLVTYSPITETRIATGMTVAELCAAALQHSDNTAANLLMRLLGGPAGVTAFARSIGDEDFRLDRWETELNEALPGDKRDTTKPAAMARSLAGLALGNILADRQREQLVQWLKGNTTGASRIRAGVPADWQVGDKTGAGSFGTTNDIAVLWRGDKAPVVLTVYFTQNRKDAPMRNDVVALAAKIATENLF